MFPLKMPSEQRYDHVPSSDDLHGTEIFDEKPLPARPQYRQPWSRYNRIASIVAAVLMILIVGFALGFASGSFLDNHSSPTPSPVSTLAPAAAPASSSTSCTDPYYRKEWRSLSTEEKKDYMDAFQCMIDSPSNIGLNGSLYNDMSWVHNLIAHSTHGKAPFLTWHRRFIFVYEKYLKTKCGYKGAVPYWDWTLDWEDPMASPIFDSKTGFGGDGDPNGPMHGTSHCVTDLPFKNMKPQWLGEKYEPHCLTRWFSEDWYGRYMNPGSLEKVMAANNYADFFLALEMGPHDIIPMGVRGDFTSFTAPNDPVFYLHHSQLDRIWWMWQMRDKKNRVHDYGGEGDNGQNVTLSDVLPLAGLDADLTVADIMDTEGGEMCYRYMYQ